MNLDFFRDAYPPICLHPRFNILHVLSLDYIIAFYPFLLVFLTYLLVTMYDRNYSIVVLAWKPFRWCSKQFIRHFNVKASLIETFATFILLSNVKILGVSFDILSPTAAYGVNGTRLNQTFLFYDANIEYLSREHIPFVILALMTGILFAFVPFLLLLVYPCRCFQKGLNRLGWRCQALHIFMDAFQGSYKTEPYDLRYFSAYYFLLRFLVLLVTSMASILNYSVLAFLVIMGAVIVTIFQPYKTNRHNKLDIVSILILALTYVSMTGYIITSRNDFRHVFISLVSMVVSVSALTIYVIGVVAWRPLVFLFKWCNCKNSCT